MSALHLRLAFQVSMKICFQYENQGSYTLKLHKWQFSTFENKGKEKKKQINVASAALHKKARRKKKKVFGLRANEIASPRNVFKFKCIRSTLNSMGPS